MSESLLIAFAVWVTVTAYIFMVLEGWSFQDAIYHCMMTATTVGLGDIAPITPSGRTFAIVHMLGSFMLFAGLLETVGSVPSVREEMASLAEIESGSGSEKGKSGLMTIEALLFSTFQRDCPESKQLPAHHRQRAPRNPRRPKPPRWRPST